MKYEILDPRPVGDNSAIFAEGAQVLGIEVTVPTLAAQCNLGNIDPQHTGGNIDIAAIEAALTANIPPADATLVTVRADLDAVGAMVILQMRQEREEISPAMMERINQIAESDKFARGGWPGIKALPTRDNPWPIQSAGTEDSPTLAAIAAAVADFKVSLESRVEMMKIYLTTGQEPMNYVERVEKERMDIIQALEDGTIEVCSDHQVATVVSTHRAATTIGYSQAPVVIAFNPAMQGKDGPYAKYSICQFEAGYINLKAILEELNTLEAGWGGSPTIGGSPQGVCSNLTMEEVEAVVRKYLLQ